MQDHGMWMEENTWKKSWPNCCELWVSTSELLSLSLKQCSLTQTNWNCLQLRMNQVTKLQFYLTLLWLYIVIASCGHCHLEYFIQDVDGDIFDQVSAHVRVSSHPGKILSQDFCNCKKSAIFFADWCVFSAASKTSKKLFFQHFLAEIKCNY